MKIIILLLCVVLIALSSCSQSISPCDTYNQAYKIRSFKPKKKIHVKRAHSPINLVRI